MGAPALLLFVALSAAAEADEPQLVVLPLEAEGVKAQLGLDAWKTVVAEVAKAKTKLHVGVGFQKELHDMLLGPAREQARDCGSNVDCLREIGRALDVGQLIAGKVTRDEVSLVAFDVATGAKLGTAKSPPAVAKSKVESKAKAAAQGLIAVMAAKKSAKGGVVAGVVTKEPAPPASNVVTEDTPPAYGVDSPPSTAESPASETSTPPINSVEAGGAIHIAKEQLTAIREVTVDGIPVQFLGDGSVEWSGAAGSHAIALLRNDGSRESREVIVDAGKTVELTVAPPAIVQNSTPSSNPSANATAIDSPQTPPPAAGPDVTSTWWFWTAIAAAVLAGGATTVVLAGGSKGGPSVPKDVGGVSGTY